MAGSDGWAVIDGQGGPLSAAALPLTDPGYLYGWIAFETLDAAPGRDPGPNLRRLAGSAAALRIPMPDEALLRAEIEAVRAALGGRAWVRVDLTGGGRRLVWGTPVDPARPHRPIRAATAPHLDHPLLAGEVKHRSRAPWIAEVRRRDVDEVLFVDRDGRFTEGTSCAVVASRGGALVTAPWDGRILRSTTLEALLADAAAAGLPVVREGARADEPLDALYVVSTTRVLAPVTVLDGRPLPGGDPLGDRLRAALTSRRSP